ncbi:DUF87 domain-containing protein [Candidatus Berkelbacteria bacterium]|nr:DUF87 domain-containing protein [Candidatus Berkelbacteria bacterium]
MDHFDWNVNPETVREVFAVGLVAIGLISMLAMFGAAGALGTKINDFFTTLLGSIHILVPFFMLGAGAVIWNPSIVTLRWSTLGGVALLFLSLAGVVSPYGGAIGNGVSSFISSLVGGLAGLIVLAAAVLMSVLLIFNTSFKSLFGGVSMPKINLKMPELADRNDNDDSRVSVFQAVKEKFKGNGAPQINTGSKAQVSQQSSTLNHKSSNAGDWQFPPLDLMNLPKGKATAGNVVKNVEVIQKTLKDFNIAVTMGDVNIGPTVTQYTLKPAEGVRLNQITSRSNDLALALAAPSIRIEAPIPGKSAVGIEVPNKVAAMVTLREVLETDEFKNVKSSLTIALGRNAAGEPKAVDLKKMPHLLIAGSTGSGKSIAINSLITGLLYQNTPEELKMILVDPKRVEFTPFNDIPHLLTPVITEPDKTINTLKWSLVEMERRYKMLQDAGSRDIISFNEKNPNNTLPYIVIVIDELADLMAQSAKEVEGAIVRLAQMARAVGMHLVVATQRPSVDVITGLIKANITTRMAFTVASQIDSRTIIDSSGAEKLLGKGDMLFISPEYSSKPRRIQGCLLTEKEIEDVTGFLKKNSPPQYNEEVANYAPKGLTGGVGGDGEVDDDLFDEARQTVVQAGKASASLLQRRLRVGYARAARLLDLLEDQGVIGPASGSKPRDVLVGLDSEFPTMSSGDSSQPPPPGFTQ